MCVCLYIRGVGGYTRQRRERQGEPGCAMNYDRWAGELAAPLKSRLIYYYVLLLLFGYLYPYNIMPREIPGSRRYVTRSLSRCFPPGSGPHFPPIGHNLESSREISNPSLQLASSTFISFSAAKIQRNEIDRLESCTRRVSRQESPSV